MENLPEQSLTKKGNIMGHTEKRSVADVYGELVRDMEQNAADPESRFFNGVRAVIIGDRIKRGEELTEEDRKLWEQWEHEHGE